MARMRSPNFPATSLEDAVKAAKSIYDKNRQAIIMRDDAAKDIGYTGLTGRSMQVLGALVQYDLLENTSKGECRVTQTAEEIFHGIPDRAKQAALRKAGHAPTLFKSVFERFEGEVPGENAVRSFLIQSGCTNDGADKALKNFLATNRYLEVNGVSESYGQPNQDHAESSTDVNDMEDSKMEPSQHGEQKSPATGVDTSFWNHGELDFSLSSAGLTVAGKTNSASDLHAFIKKLEALAALLPEGKTEH